MEKERISIYNVAKKAGVSISTVSRVLNNSANVKPNKVDAVRKAIKELNYVPNELARGLSKNITKMIGFYMISSSLSLFDSKYGLELLRGVDSFISKTDYSLVILNENINNLNELNEPKYISYIRQSRIDGLILFGTSKSNKHFSYFEETLNSDFPVAYIGKRIDNRGFNVYAGYENYIYSMLDIFYKNGHRKIVLVISFHNLNRITQIIHKFRMDNIDYIDINIIETSLSYSNKNLIESLKDLISIKKCTGIFSDTVSSLFVILGFLNFNNLSIPEDISVIAIEHKKDDCAGCYPQVSSFFVPGYDMGIMATEMLMSSLHGKAVQEKSRNINISYIDRGSVKNIM